MPLYIYSSLHFFNDPLRLLVSSPLPTIQNPKHSSWKIKKWASYISSNLFRRYRDPSILKETIEKKFCAIFPSTYVPQLMQDILKIIYEKAERDIYLPDLVVFHCLDFLVQAIQHPEVYKNLKSSVNWIFQKICFKLLLITEDDMKLWHSDPEEFLRKESDIFEDFATPKSVATHFVNSICKRRTKHHLGEIMNFLSQILMQYIDFPLKNNEENKIEKKR